MNVIGWMMMGACLWQSQAAELIVSSHGQALGAVRSDGSVVLAKRVKKKAFMKALKEQAEVKPMVVPDCVLEELGLPDHRHFGDEAVVQTVRK